MTATPVNIGPRGIGNGCPDLFSGNNLDAEDMDGVKNHLMVLAQQSKALQQRPLRVLLVPISKSGTTLEPTAAFLHFYSYLQEQDHLFQVSGAVVTDKQQEKGPLNRLAREFSWPVFDIPVGVGGRFSVLSTQAGGSCCPWDGPGRSAPRSQGDG